MTLVGESEDDFATQYLFAPFGGAGFLAVVDRCICDCVGVRSCEYS